MRRRVWDPYLTWPSAVGLVADGWAAPRMDLLLIPYTPRAYARLGFPDLAWYHSAAKLEAELAVKGTRGAGGSLGHGLSPQDMRSLPELLQRPQGIFWSEGSHSRLNVLLDATDSGGSQVVAIVDLLGVAHDPDDGEVPCVYVVSAYGADSLATRMAAAAACGGWVWLDRSAVARAAEISAPGKDHSFVDHVVPTLTVHDRLSAVTC